MPLAFYQPENDDRIMTKLKSLMSISNINDNNNEDVPRYNNNSNNNNLIIRDKDL